MKYITEINMEQHLLDRLTLADRNVLVNILSLFRQAQVEWAKIDGGKQCELNELHNEEASLAHCLRWGTQASKDIVEEIVEMTSDVKSKPTAKTKTPSM